MKEYKVRVLDEKGKVGVEQIPATDRDALRSRLASRGLSLLEIESEKINSQNSYTLKERSAFFEALTTLLNANILLSEAVDFLSNELGGHLRVFCLHVSESLKNGVRFSDALQELVPTISIMELGIIRIGETVGSLARILPNLVDQLKREKAFKEKILSALTYPLFVIGILVLGISAFVFIFLPAIQENLGMNNPEAAARIQTTVGVFIGMLVFLVISILSGLVLSVFYRESKKGNRAFALRFEGLLHSLPLAGRFLRERHLIRINQTLALLIEHGVPLEEALRICAKTIDHAGYSTGLERASVELHEGRNISEALAASGAFPQRMIEWVRIVERTGNPGQSFSYLAKYYEERYDTYLVRALALVEPVLIVCLVVLFVVLGTLVPFFESMGRF